NAVGAVVSVLRRRGIFVNLLAAGPAAVRFAYLGLNCGVINDGFNPDLLVGASLLITGTSGSDSREQSAIFAARTLGISSLAISDFWGNVPLRFSSRIAEHSEPIRPDVVTALDQAHAIELEAGGFRRTQIALTGQPYFAQLPGIPASRNSYLMPTRSLLVVSQPIAEEQAALRTIAAGAAEAGVHYISVRLHPRATNKEEVFTALRSAGAAVIADSTADIAISAHEHDAVLGISSLALLEACCAGAAVGRIASDTAIWPSSLDELVVPLRNSSEVAAYLLKPRAGSSEHFRAVHRNADLTCADLVMQLLTPDTSCLNDHGQFNFL
ncbi:MAG TPA: hypothetical protein VLO13_04110, partial [Halomonas sp.]|nr:hypothetical protein [Halomonas sp.]